MFLFLLLLLWISTCNFCIDSKFFLYRTVWIKFIFYKLFCFFIYILFFIYFNAFNLAFINIICYSVSYDYLLIALILIFLIPYWNWDMNGNELSNDAFGFFIFLLLLKYILYIPWSWVVFLKDESEDVTYIVLCIYIKFI